jgi:hypothetical protein
MTTPVVMDTFSRFMADMFDDKEIMSVSTGFQAFFGRPETGANTVFSANSLVVDIDIIRGNEKTAALIPRSMISRPLGDNQRNMNVEKYTAFSRKYPLSEEEGDITGDQILQRMAGENPYDQRSRLDRTRALGLKLHHENIRRHVRLFERLAVQSIRTGKQDAILGTADTDLQYDFRRAAAHTITPANKWNSGSQTIMADIDSACELIRANGKTVPDMIIIGGSAMNAFLADTVTGGVQQLADNRRFELINVSLNNPVPPGFARFVEAGFIPRGRLRTPKGFELWIFNYIDIYENQAGTAVKYMLDSEAIIASSRARCDRYFGPPEQIPMTSNAISDYQDLFGFNPLSAPMPLKMRAPGNIVEPSMFYCDAYISGDRKKVSIRTQSAPIFATTHTDAFATLNTLV